MSRISTPEVAGVPGAVTQARAAALAALRLASHSMIVLALIGSVAAIHSEAARAADERSLQSHRAERQFTPIVNGRHVQPTQADLPRAQESSPQAVVNSFNEGLLETMKNARALGPQGRFARLEPVMMRAFDMPRMTEVAVGEDWGKLSDGQREKLVAAYTRFLVAQYADWFDGNNGQDFRIGAVTAAPDGTALVSTAMINGASREVRSDYTVRQGASGWKIVDIRYGGWFSELDRRHSEFTDVLNQYGVDALVARLEAGTQSAVSSPDNIESAHILDPRPDMWSLPIIPFH